MSQVSKWFERKFEFSFPVELYPNLGARLRGLSARLEEVLRGRAHEVLTRKPRKEWRLRSTRVTCWTSSPFGWRDGKLCRCQRPTHTSGLEKSKNHEANHNARPLEEILADFRSVREALLKRLDQVDVTSLVRTIPHPRLKTPMRLVDHLSLPRPNTTIIISREYGNW